ncbi:MAG: phosphoglucosamine mutase [Christensenella sp.]|uniref:phosphoglucosamine mutase n=1 Tax=Christensenella sp. TaxID=1935934 RepID=UPI002B21E335|nr:phosphoglucosamine mutase [Christensenella sp.]MEA5004267.1 phosphoglucosamine mutase [Christensenella sp.]
MARLFGTDGVRGIANEKLTSKLAYDLGRAGAYCLTNEIHSAKILIGKDTRGSGDMLESAMVAGICSAGAEAVVACTLPTSAIAYLTRHSGYDAGVVISASHNTVEYNGIKFFNSSGYKLADEIEDRIENIILNDAEEIPQPTGKKIGRRVRLKKAAQDYIDFVVETTDVSLEGLKIVLDCANGAASEVAPWIFKLLGAEVIPYYNTPDGNNINENCGSTHPDQLSRLVLELGADLGLAFDGDADRLIAVDEHGSIVDGDKIMAISALDMKRRGTLQKDTVVATVMSNMGMEMMLKENGITMVRSDVGDRYVLEEMLRDGYNFGGEQSGHIIFLDHSTTGDGILSGVQLAAVMKREDMPLARLARPVSIYPQVLVNAKVSDDKKHDYETDEMIADEIKKLEQEFHGEGRVLIRTSGTEPLVRVMIEGKDKDAITKHAVKMGKLIEQRLK